MDDLNQFKTKKLPLSSAAPMVSQASDSSRKSRRVSRNTANSKQDLSPQMNKVEIRLNMDNLKLQPM